MSKRSSVESTSTSTVPTAPPPSQTSPLTTTEMPAFQLAAALANLEARTSGPPPSLLVHGPESTPAPQVATPVVKITNSDVEAVEAIATAGEQASRVTESSAADPIDLVVVQPRLAAVDLPVDDDAILTVAGDETGEATVD